MRPRNAAVTATAGAPPLAAWPVIAARLVIAVQARPQDGPGARDCLGMCGRQQRRGRLPAVLAGTGHAGRDQPAHDGAEKEVPFHLAMP
jgi:hypothetical protein